MISNQQTGVELEEVLMILEIWLPDTHITNVSWIVHLFHILCWILTRWYRCTTVAELYHRAVTELLRNCRATPRRQLGDRNYATVIKAVSITLPWRTNMFILHSDIMATILITLVLSGYCVPRYHLVKI